MRATFEYIEGAQAILNNQLYEVVEVAYGPTFEVIWPCVPANPFIFDTVEDSENGMVGLEQLYDIYIRESGSGSGDEIIRKNVSEILRHLKLIKVAEGTANEHLMILSDIGIASLKNIVAGGIQSSGSGSGVNIPRVWQSLTTTIDNSYHINPAHIPTISLTGDASGTGVGSYDNTTNRGTISIQTNIAKGNVNLLLDATDTTYRLWTAADLAQYVGLVPHGSGSGGGGGTVVVTDLHDPLVWGTEVRIALINSTAITAKLPAKPTYSLSDITGTSNLQDIEDLSGSGLLKKSNGSWSFDTNNYLTQHQDISGKADKATTLSGYGIGDAYIGSGEIHLGSNSIKPLVQSDVENKSQTLVSGNSGLVIATIGSQDITVNVPAFITGESLAGYKTIASLMSKGSSTLPVYFDSSGNAQTIDGLVVGGNISTTGGYLSVAGNTYFGGTSNPYMYWDSSNNALHYTGNFIADGYGVFGGIRSGSGAGDMLERVWASLTNTLLDQWATTKINAAHLDLTGYQPLLVSGTNIKTINGISLLGSGNINITGGSGGGTVVGIIVDAGSGSATYTPDENGLITLPDYPVTGTINWDNYFGIDENDNIYVKPKNENQTRGFWNRGFGTFGGIGSGSGSGSGINLGRVWQSLKNEVSDQWANDKIAREHIPVASSNGIGGIKVGFATAGRNYKVQLDSNNNAYVNVPWENTEYSASDIVTLLGSTPVNRATADGNGNIIVESYAAALTAATNALSLLSKNSSVLSILTGNDLETVLNDRYVHNTSDSMSGSLDIAVNLLVGNHVTIGSGSGPGYFYWDSEHNALRYTGNFIGDGFGTFGGVNSGSGSGDMLTRVWQSLTNAVTDQWATTKIAGEHLPLASASQFGVVKIGSGISVTDGVISTTGGGGTGGGTVTSVGLQAGSGSGLLVTGTSNPITGSGTFTIGVDSSHAIPTTTQLAYWQLSGQNLTTTYSLIIGTSAQPKAVTIWGGASTKFLVCSTATQTSDNSVGTAASPWYAIYGTTIYGTTIYEGGTTLASKYQAKLISGTNIKTINNQSLLGSGNITISGGSGSGISSVSLAGGSSNGTLKLVVDGTSSSDVAVTGLQALAFKASLAFSDLTAHPTTISDYGITDAKINNGTITLGNNSLTPLTSSAISDMATITWVTNQHYLTQHQDISGKADKATTLAGYGITDAKIANGVITLGSNTITPLTAASSLNAANLTGTVPSSCYTDTNTDIRFAEYYGSCITPASTVKKVTENNSVSSLTLTTGITAIVYHSTTTSASNPTLNIAGSGDKPMYDAAGANRLTGSSTKKPWNQHDIIRWVYDSSLGTAGGWRRDAVLGNGESHRLRLLTDRVPLYSFTESDPTVPAWAKEENKPSYTFSEIGSKPTSLSGYGITDVKFGTAGTDYVPITLGSTTKNVLTAHQSLASYITTATANSSFVSGVAIGTGTNASKLAVTKNNTTSYLTIPYADTANTATYAMSAGSATSATTATNATTAEKLSTVSKKAWGQTYWTGGGVPTDISGDMSNVGNIAFSASGKNIASLLYFDTTNNRVGVYKSSPTTALDVNGVIHASTGVRSEGYGTFGIANSSSDVRMKSKIKLIDLKKAIDTICKLKPSTWEWNELTPLRGKCAGLIAQEVEEVLPFAVHESGIYKTLNYDIFHAYEIAGLQDHEKRIRNLENQLNNK